jgi:hypothetical protein
MEGKSVKAIFKRCGPRQVISGCAQVQHIISFKKLYEHTLKSCRRLKALNFNASLFEYG